jgi:TRAP-type transport system periplasmic protein
MQAGRRHELRRRDFVRSAAMGLSAVATGAIAAPALAQTSKKVTLKFGYTSTPTNPVSIGYETFARLVKEKSGGDVVVTTFCCNQVGNDQELVQSAQSGAIQMGTSSNNNLDQFTSKMMVLELPYLLRSRAAYRKFWTTGSEDIRHDFETKLGLRILMVMDAAGFRSIETASHVIRKPADLKGMKLRAANTPIELATFKAWGANPVPLPYNQVFTALQQGTVDGEILQPVWFFTDKHYEAAKKICDIHYTMLSHIGFINLRFFNRLPKDVQDVLLAAARGAEDMEWTEADKAASDANAKLKAMAEIDWFEPLGADLAAWQDQSRPIWDQFADRVGADLIKRVDALNT